MEENLSLENLGAEEIWEKLYTYKKSSYAAIRNFPESFTIDHSSLITKYHYKKLLLKRNILKLKALVY